MANLGVGAVLVLVKVYANRITVKTGKTYSTLSVYLGEGVPWHSVQDVSGFEDPIYDVK